MLDLSALNSQQREAVETLDGPVLILAGAGTGKTRVITYRLAHLIARGILPSSILAVTFTNKAAREMQERVHRLIPNTPRRKSKAAVGTPLRSELETGAIDPNGRGMAASRPIICTFHSLGRQILRRHIHRLGYKANFVIYDENDQLAAVKKILANMTPCAEKVDLHQELARLSRFRNGGSTPSGPDAAEVLERSEWLLQRYQSALRACNAVDFDDLILLTLRLFREHPDALEASRRQFRYVMVDEYQDTNAAQFELVHMLTAESRRLCVVGDDDQSIYGWRGAEVANLLNLERHFPEVKIVKLEQNYRSTHVILQAANAVIRNNVRRRGKSLWSSKGPGAKVQLQCFESDEEEARTVAENMSYDIARRILWRDQAVLFRTNQQSRPLETALRQARIRYRVVGGQSFFDRREVRDVLAYLKMLINPDDDVSILRIANVPARGLSDEIMERLLAASQERKCSVFSAMRHTDVQQALAPRAAASVRAWVDWIERTRTALESPMQERLSAWAEKVLASAGYWDAVRRWVREPDEGANRIKNMRELLATMDSAGSDPDRPRERLAEFLADLSLENEREEADEDQRTDAVTLITMHSCKGLEFPHVHIVGLEDGLLPHSRAKTDGTMDEERRLFYVAITRAGETLRISHCRGRKRYGQMMPCHPSPFLKELPEECVENVEVTAKRVVTADEGENFFIRMRAAID